MKHSAMEFTAVESMAIESLAMEPMPIESTAVDVSHIIFSLHLITFIAVRDTPKIPNKALSESYSYNSCIKIVLQCNIYNY